jgi:hypothetical protein
MMMLALAALAGCAAAPIEAPATKIEAVEVKVAVSKPCIEQAPAEVAYRWGVGPLPATDKEKVAMLLSDYELARQRDVDWQAAAAGCVVKR